MPFPVFILTRIFGKNGTGFPEMPFFCNLCFATRIVTLKCEKITLTFFIYFADKMQARLDFAARSRQTKSTLWWGAVKLQNSSCRGCGLTALLTALLIHAPQIKIPHPAKSTWIGDFLNDGGQDFGRIGRHEVVRIHQLPPKRDTYKGVSFFCFACFLRGYRWWIRTARAPRLRPAGQKCPSGAFLGRGLRIHQLPPKEIRN
mgnify:CR=1 FL=1